MLSHRLAHLWTNMLPRGDAEVRRDLKQEVCDLPGFIFQVDDPGCLWADVRTEPGLGDLLGSSRGRGGG